MCRRYSDEEHQGESGRSEAKRTLEKAHEPLVWALPIRCHQLASPFGLPNFATR